MTPNRKQTPRRGQTPSGGKTDPPIAKRTRLGGKNPGGRRGLRSDGAGSESGGKTRSKTRSKTKPNYTEGVVLKRPGWHDHTRQEVLDKASPKQVGGETHYKCAKGKCPKGKTYHPASNIQVDHITAWQKHIDNKVDDISDKGALKEAYNDPSNLQALCKSCNAKKGNREGAALAKQFRKK
jgi:5-methylcytosine-specific restriction endonuclease McrA